MSKPIALSPKLIRKLALAAVEEVASSDLPGASKHSAATRLLAKKVDDALKWPPTPLGLLAETLDGPAASVVIRLLGGFVQSAYRRWKRKQAKKGGA